MAVPTVAFTSLGATVRALAAADKPMLIGENWMRDLGTAPQWKQGGSWAAGSDETDSDGPTSCAYDDFDHVRTYPDSSQTAWYFLIDFGANGAGVFDVAAILNPANLTGVQVDLQVADNNAYDSNLRTIATTTPTDNDRIIFLDLDHGVGVEQQYSDVRYARLKFTKVAGFVPRFGELIIGRRRQLPYKPMRPYDANDLITRQSAFESDSGVDAVYVYNKKRRSISIQIRLADQTYIDEVESFWEDDTDGGSLPFLYIDDPATYPSKANWMYEPSGRFSSPHTEGSLTRVWQLDAIEKGPNYLKLET